MLLDMLYELCRSTYLLICGDGVRPSPSNPCIVSAVVGWWRARTGGRLAFSVDKKCEGVWLTNNYRSENYRGRIRYRAQLYSRVFTGCLVADSVIEVVRVVIESKYKRNLQKRERCLVSISAMGQTHLTTVMTVSKTRIRRRTDQPKGNTHGKIS